MKPESFEKKLYIIRDVEGAPNNQELDMIRGLESEVAQDECFVGIAPFGSLMEGYGAKESDVDLIIFFDDSGRSIKNAGEKTEKINNLIEQVNVWEETTKQSEKDVHVLFTNVNPESIIYDLKAGAKQGDAGKFVATTLAEMSRMVTGKKIDQYRKIIAAELSELTPEQKKVTVDAIVESLARREKMRLSKRVSRMPELSVEEHQKILDARKEMWRVRVKKIWGL